MLSRRSIRIKAMQALFIQNKDSDVAFKEAADFFDRLINESYELYLFNLYALLGITEFAQGDQVQRKLKHLPTAEDKAFSDKLFSNDLVQSLVNNSYLVDKFEDLNFASKLDKDLLKKVYRKFTSEDNYKRYILNTDTDRLDHIAILHDLYRVCRRDELFDEIMEDNYPNWLDDKSLVIGSIKKTIKGLPAKSDFYLAYIPDAETVDVFGRELLNKVHTDSEYLSSLVEPVLENWDVDRVAHVDMLFIKMALCEFLNFVTIPTKVTLNEYVELSKDYSTEKSKDFINGILDKLMRRMKEDGMIKKEGRGLLA